MSAVPPLLTDGSGNRSLRAHFTKEGRPKRRFSELAAKSHAARHGHEAYRCWWCGCWHTGR